MRMEPSELYKDHDRCNGKYSCCKLFSIRATPGLSLLFLDHPITGEPDLARGRYWMQSMAHTCTFFRVALLACA